MPREQEAAQTLLCPMETKVIGEKKASAAFLREEALGLLFVTQVVLKIPEDRSRKFGAFSEIGSRC